MEGHFAFDTTTAATTCPACRDAHVAAALRAYLGAPGIVLRCATCDPVQLRLIRSPQRAWLDLSGVAALTSLPLTRGRPAGDDAPAHLEERREPDHLRRRGS